MPIKVHHAIIHGFSKDVDGPIQDVRKTEVLLDSESMNVKTLVVGMAALFGKKGSNKQWGHFGADNREGRFPDSFDECVEDAANPQEFLRMSHVALDEVVGRAAEEPWATGGHLLCALYEFTPKEEVALVEDDEGADEHLWEGPSDGLYCLVAMVKQKGGLSLDDQLVPVGNKSVDLSKLHQAALIQVEKYRASQSPQNGDAAKDDAGDEVQPDIYLSFVGQAARGSAAYFVDALGCTVGINSSRATKMFFEAVAEYFEERELLRPYHGAARDRLVKHLEQSIEDDEPVSIAAIRDIVLRDVPERLTRELDDLEAFMNDAQRQVPSTFIANKAMVTRVKRVTLKSERFDLKFDRQLLGADANSDFHYSKRERTLTIRNLDDDLIRKLDKVLAER